jgi:hypothetical protein
MQKKFAVIEGIFAQVCNNCALGLIRVNEMRRFTISDNLEVCPITLNRHTKIKGGKMKDYLSFKKAWNQRTSIFFGLNIAIYY